MSDSSRPRHRFRLRLLNENPHETPTQFLIRCVTIWLYTALFLFVAMKSAGSPIWLRVVLIALLAWMTFWTFVALIKLFRHRPSANHSAPKQ
jgi:membrane protein YdbS with pleckstrin-like domain